MSVPDNLPTLISTGAVTVIMGLALWRILKDSFAPVKTVKARVVDKTTVETFSRYRGNGKSIRYCIVFEAEGKRLAFYVSEFSYGGYRKGERGTLTYKGSRLLDFHG